MPEQKEAVPIKDQMHLVLRGPTGKVKAERLSSKTVKEGRHGTDKRARTP